MDRRNDERALSQHNCEVLIQSGQPLQHFAFECNPMVRIAVIGGDPRA
jgi:hypothetical protein